jgi:hypothetical protein
MKKLPLTLSSKDQWEKIKTKVENIFNKNIEKQDAGCWLWTKGKPISFKRNKYGYTYLRFDVNKIKLHVQKVSYYLKNGYFENMVVVTSCENKFCINPDHLFLAKSANLARTHCSKGHILNEENSYYHKRSNGKYKTACRMCSANRSGYKSFNRVLSTRTTLEKLMELSK